MNLLPNLRTIPLVFLCETFVAYLGTSFHDSWLHSALLCKVLDPETANDAVRSVFLSKVSPFMNKLKLLGFVAGVRVLYEICVGLFRSSVVFGVRGLICYS